MSSVVEDIYGEQSDAYANLAGLAVLVFDYCITLDQEVNWVWGRRWDVGRWVFLLARYLPFPGLALTNYAAMQAVSLKQCSGTGSNGLASNVLHTVSILAAEGLLGMRIWAFWECRRPLLIILLTLAIIFSVAAITLSQLLNIGVAQDGPLSTVCHFTTGKGSAVQYAFLVTYELLLLFLVLYRWLRHYRAVKLNLVYVIYRDAVLYVSLMIVFSVANVVDALAAPAFFNEYPDSLQVTIHSVLSTRLFFHLRQIDAAERDQGLSHPVSTFQVRRPDDDSLVPHVSVHDIP